MGTAWFAVFGALVIIFQVRRLPFVIINFCHFPFCLKLLKINMVNVTLPAAIK